MKTPLLLCGALCCSLWFSHCGRDIRKLHIEKRIYRPGWYVSIPPRGEPITHAYPPPVQTPVAYPTTVPQPRQSTPLARTPAAAAPLPSPPSPPAAAQAPMPPATAPPPPRDSAVAAQPPPAMPDSSGSPTATASSHGVDVQGGLRVFAAVLLPAGRRNFPLAAGTGFAGVGYTLAFAAGPRLAVLAACSYRYARLPVKQTLQRPLPLPETAAAKEKIRLHTLCTETALRLSLPGKKFISSVDAGLGIERIVRSAYLAKSNVQQPLPATGQQSVAVTKTKANSLYGLKAWSGYITGGISHAGWRLFFNYRLTRQTTHETDFPRVAFGICFSTI